MLSKHLINEFFIKRSIVGLFTSNSRNYVKSDMFNGNISNGSNIFSKNISNGSNMFNETSKRDFHELKFQFNHKTNIGINGSNIITQNKTLFNSNIISNNVLQHEVNKFSINNNIICRNYGTSGSNRIYCNRGKYNNKSDWLFAYFMAVGLIFTGSVYLAYRHHLSNIVPIDVIERRERVEDLMAISESSLREADEILSLAEDISQFNGLIKYNDIKRYNDLLIMLVKHNKPKLFLQLLRSMKRHINIKDCYNKKDVFKHILNVCGIELLINIASSVHSEDFQNILKQCDFYNFAQRKYMMEYIYKPYDRIIKSIYNICSKQKDGAEIAKYMIMYCEHQEPTLDVTEFFIQAIRNKDYDILDFLNSDNTTLNNIYSISIEGHTSPVYICKHGRQKDIDFMMFGTNKREFVIIPFLERNLILVTAYRPVVRQFLNHINLTRNYVERDDIAKKNYYYKFYGLQINLAIDILFERGMYDTIEYILNNYDYRYFACYNSYDLALKIISSTSSKNANEKRLIELIGTLFKSHDLKNEKVFDRELQK